MPERWPRPAWLESGSAHRAGWGWQTPAARPGARPTAGAAQVAAWSAHRGCASPAWRRSPCPPPRPDPAWRHFRDRPRAACRPGHCPITRLASRAGRCPSCGCSRPAQTPAKRRPGPGRARTTAQTPPARWHHSTLRPKWPGPALGGVAAAQPRAPRPTGWRRPVQSAQKICRAHRCRSRYR